MSMREKKKPEKERKKPRKIYLREWDKLSNFGSRPDLKEEFSKPKNTGKTDEWRSALRGQKTDVKPMQPWKGHPVEYDPRTKKPRYKGQKSDSEVPKGRTVPPEELAERREPDTEIRITRNVSAEQLEKQRREREMIVKPDETEEKEKSGEPKKKKTHTERAQEKFDDFMREKPKDPKDSS